MVSEYVAINREAQLNTAHDTTEWLAGQISDLKSKLDKENNQLQAFAASSGLLYSANQSSLTEQRVREIAHIMGGNVTEFSMKSAEEMLARSYLWKETWTGSSHRKEVVGGELHNGSTS